MKRFFFITLILCLFIVSPTYALPPSGGAESFTDLDDSPGSFTGQAGKVIVVNSTETKLSYSSLAERLIIPVVPQGSALTTGDSQNCIPIPSMLNGLNLVAVEASVGTASSSGTPTFQLHRVRSGVSADMLSTRITIDANELTSTTAVTAAVIDTANDDLVSGDIVCVDVDVAGTGTLGLAAVAITAQRGE